VASGLRSKCAVKRGEVDLEHFEQRDGEWRRIGLAAPARRALVSARLTQLRQLAKWTRTDIASLHGMGPNAMRKLDEAMKSGGFSYRS